MLFAFGGLLSGGFLLLSHFLGPKKVTPEKGSTYECGLSPTSTPRHRVAVKFYLVAMIFILFDVEVVFLYPWAVLFRDFIRQGVGAILFFEMVAFLGILTAGLVYIYNRQALHWEE